MSFSVKQRSHRLEGVAFAFKAPDVFGQLCLIPMPFLSKTQQVVRVSLFKKCFRRTYIHLWGMGTVRLQKTV